LIALSVAWYSKRPSPTATMAPEQPHRVVLATIIAFEGEVQAVDLAGNAIPLEMQVRLPVQSEMKTGSGRAELLLANGGEVWMDYQTRLVLSSHTSLRVVQGRIMVDMPPQGRGFCVTTPHGTATVTGTRFEVDSTDRSACVAVLRGNVECRNGQGAQTVTSGNFSEISSQAAPTPAQAWTQREPGLWTAGLRPAGTSLILNGGAEELTPKGLPQHWDLYLGNVPRPVWGAKTGVSHTGLRAAFLTVDKPDSESYYCCGVVAGDCDGYSGGRAYAVLPDSVYRISAWIRGNGFKRQVALEAWGFDEKGGARDRSLGSTRLLPTDTWTRHELFIKTSSTTRRLAPLVFIYGRKDRDIVPGATVYVDDVELRPVENKTD
jgi:hypothetical protein